MKEAVRRLFLYAVLVTSVLWNVNEEVFLAQGFHVSHSPSRRKIALPTRRGETTTTSSSSSTTAREPVAINTVQVAENELRQPVCIYHQVLVPTTQSGPPRQAVSVEDLTPTVQSFLAESQMKHGVVHIMSRHTTTVITINERESRLARDIENHFLSLVPPDERSESPVAQPGRRYWHNDIDQRPESEQEADRCRQNGWNIDDLAQLQSWRDQEPINAHSHLIAMMLGSSECVPVVDGQLSLGSWQSILLVDVDGPRDRTVAIQLMGYK